MPDVKNPSPLIANARVNRRNMELGEVAVWVRLRGRALGVGFRRQHPIGPYILDFACLALRLAVEVDGSQHYDAVAADSIRDQYLRDRGWTVLRFTTHDVLTNPDFVVGTILEAIHHLSST